MVFLHEYHHVIFVKRVCQTVLKGDMDMDLIANMKNFVKMRVSEQESKVGSVAQVQLLRLWSPSLLPESRLQGL